MLRRDVFDSSDILQQFVPPPPLFEFRFGPETLCVADIRHGARHDRYDIEAKRHIREGENAAINLRGSRDLALLLQIDGRNGRGKLFRAAGLDLDKAKRFPVKSDDVDLTGNLHALGISADGNLEIRSNQPIAALSQKFRSEPFALGTKARSLINFKSGIHWIRQAKN